MDFDKVIKNGKLTIYCSDTLEDFSNEFIKYYNEHINEIKSRLCIKKDIDLIVALTDDVKDAGFVYEVSDFSGFFNNTGAFAYINLNGKRSKDSMFKGIMHEITHHLYKYYVYGKDKKRITWVDEGIAQLLSKQKEELEDLDLYSEFLNKNLLPSKDLCLNELNHKDKSFGYKNGYNLSYIAIRYLYETNDLEEFIKIISSTQTLEEIGNTILNDVYNCYNLNRKYN